MHEPEQAVSAGGQLEQLRDLARARGVHTLVLRSPATLSWLTGARWHTQQSLHSPCFDVVLDGLDGSPGSPVGVRVVTSVIEAPRLRDIELAGAFRDDYEIDTVDWDQDRTDRLPAGPGVGSDEAARDHPGGRVDLADAVAGLRRVLTPWHRAELTTLAAESTRLVGQVARTVRTGNQERAIAGRLAGALVTAGIDPVVLFVGSDHRLTTHRHPLATGRPVERVAMLACVVRRRGVVASVTRVVAPGRLTSQEHDRYLALLHVEAAFLSATRVGTTLGEAFVAGTASYAEHGFDPLEWRRHHQGGLSGFAPREALATAASRIELADGMVCAWNPTGDGWKVEDTTLVGPQGPTTLDLDPGWPTLTVAGRRRPDVLRLT
ncbi:Xaa-Pro peptidase family protein [Actinotalea sp. K2]|uniref:M24 family metallopeptidase n=1 Tax=Actinotalea sp. K2 TaxID=2939438 RepID=UPI00201756B2|nr:M24 family metallopeptidase [Actinotalea sp. K2]MCL3861800.1 M24 family metallopeptidase [Actinotalea sp. K2]